MSTTTESKRMVILSNLRHSVDNIFTLINNQANKDQQHQQYDSKEFESRISQIVQQHYKANKTDLSK